MDQLSWPMARSRSLSAAHQQVDGAAHPFVPVLLSVHDLAVVQQTLQQAGHREHEPAAGLPPDGPPPLHLRQQAEHQTHTDQLRAHKTDAQISSEHVAIQAADDFYLLLRNALWLLLGASHQYYVTN